MEGGQKRDRTGVTDETLRQWPRVIMAKKENAAREGSSEVKGTGLAW